MGIQRSVVIPLALLLACREVRRLPFPRPVVWTRGIPASAVSCTRGLSYTFVVE